MALRSLSQEVLSEVSSDVISFQTELHSLISWVKSSGLFQDKKIFEDMHHGITLNREFEKYNLHIRTLGLGSSKVFVSDDICMSLFHM